MSLNIFIIFIPLMLPLNSSTVNFFLSLTIYARAITNDKGSASVVLGRVNVI